MADALTVKGVILKSTEFKEKDRLVSILTQKNGLITVCVKGISKPGSKNAFASMPFSLCEFVITDSHGFYYLKDGTIIESNSKIMESIDSITVASHIADCLCDSTLQSDNSEEAYELAVYAFYALANIDNKHRLICAAFNWRLLSITGQTIEYTKTNDTGEMININSKYSLSVNGGEIYSKSKSTFDVEGKTVIALNFFSSCKLNQLFAFKADDLISRQLLSFTVLYLSVQFDKEYEVATILNSFS